MERLVMASFAAAGHEFHLYAYDEFPDLPHGIVLRDANEILPGDWIFRDDRGSLSSYANVFRYKLLLENGGWWVDTDVVCIRPFEFTDDYVFATEPDGTIGSDVFRVPPGSEVMAYMWESCLKVGRENHQWGAVGPRLLGEAVSEHGLSNKAVEASVFNPYDWCDWEDALNPYLVWEFEPATRAVHLWNSMWRLAGLDKDAAFPRGCLYEQLKARHLRPGGGHTVGLGEPH